MTIKNKYKHEIRKKNYLKQAQKKVRIEGQKNK